MMIIASDPLLSSDIGFSVVAVMLLKVVLAFALLMVSVMLVIWFERKIVADMHNRVGPSLAGPWGILQMQNIMVVFQIIEVVKEKR